MVDIDAKMISVFPDVKILVHGLMSLSIYFFFRITIIWVVTVDMGIRFVIRVFFQNVDTYIPICYYGRVGRAVTANERMDGNEHG